MSIKAKFDASGRDVHIDVPLSNVAIDYRPDGFIADMIAPIVPVAKQSDMIPEFNRDDAYRIENTDRAPGTHAKKVTRDVSTHTYFCKNYALMKDVTIEDRMNADPIYAQKLYNNAATYVTGKLLLDWENRVATQVTNTSNVGSSSAVSSSWTDYSNSDPLTDIWAAIDNVQDSNGLKPNRIVFGDKAWRNFRRNTNVLNKIFGTNNGGGYASIPQVSNLLDIPNIMVGGAYKNTANPSQSESLTQIWDDNVIIYFAPSNPSIDDPSFMYSFRWSLPGLPNMQAERHPYDSKAKAESVEVGYYQDEKIIKSSYAFLITAVTSST